MDKDFNTLANEQFPKNYIIECLNTFSPQFNPTIMVILFNVHHKHFIKLMTPTKEKRLSDEMLKQRCYSCPIDHNVLSVYKTIIMKKYRSG